ncbi:two-component system response regulator [Streptomyces sp. VRA16 Mangrove soil]|uniref:response regulator n=1 Tax=Streptomyces sp. VRA16 Mangrove soil TaxID=2817434 RepID=UPI001A9D877F|nr:response regulator [Streptomyces sp. VRA16 Mangrove soil]MBO1332989.1 response regulator [Streptomyces sp. VRA16 Mangrove soil]
MPTVARPKILVVDDRDDTLFAMESALAPLGYPMDRASSGDEALKTVLRGGVALVLLDVLMPDISGLEVAQYMTRVEQTQDIPIMLITGAGQDPTLASKAFELGVADYVVKPIDPWVMRTKVRYLYEMSRRLHALRERLRAYEHRSEEFRGPASLPVEDRPLPRPA